MSSCFAVFGWLLRLWVSCCNYIYIYKKIIIKIINLIKRGDFHGIFLLFVIIDFLVCRSGSASTPWIAVRLESFDICSEFEFLGLGLLNWVQILVFLFLLLIDLYFLLIFFHLFLLLLVHLWNLLDSIKDLLVCLLHVNGALNFQLKTFSENQGPFYTS